MVRHGADGVGGSGEVTGVEAGAGRGGELRSGWISLREKAFWDDWGAWEKQLGYSAEEIRRARILPDLLWGRSVRGLPGTWRTGAAAAGCACGHARPIRRVVLTPDRERGAFARNATVCAEGYAGLAF
jgi:hypothetical protein